MTRALLFVVGVACSSAPPPSEGVPRPTIANKGCKTNPYGVCCPSVPEITIETADGRFVSLCDLYDPDQRGIPGIDDGVPIRLIHVVGLASWAGPASAEADFINGTNFTGANASMTSWAAELAPLGVVFLEAFVPPADLQKVPQGSTGVLAGIETGTFFDAAAIPFNADIDARTLVTLDTNVGFDSNLPQSIEQVLARSR